MSGTRSAVSSRDWRTSAACQGIDQVEIFSDRPTVQAQVQRVCRACPVRATCLTDAMAYEADDYMVWGVAGGLTDLQRRALRVESWLGHEPNLEQAWKLTRPVFAQFMSDWRDWPPETVAGELRKLGILASPVTVRVALWWTGAKASLLRPKAPGDRRRLWQQVRDECRDVVTELREMGLGVQAIAAYIGVSHWQVEQALKAWKLADQAAEAVKAA